MRRLVNTSIPLFFGLMMLQTVGAGCTSLVEVGDNSGDDGDVGPNGVTGGEESSASSGGSSSTTGGGSEPATAGAIALFGSQLPEQPAPGWLGGVLDPNPEDLFVFIGAPVNHCANPHEFLGCDTWHVAINIPPAMQVPGVIDLSAPDLVPFATAHGPSYPSGRCEWSFAGGFVPGTLEIVSIDAAKVVIRLSGTSTEDFDANGEYTAARCP